MKGIEFKCKSNLDSKIPNRESGHPDREICGCTTRLGDGVGQQMTLFSLRTRALRIRAASRTSIARFHGHFDGGSHPWPLQSNIEAIKNHQAWLVKVVGTLFVHLNSLEGCLHYLRKNLTPSIEFEVVN
ncbi:hypothetical protein SLA2020_525640 [Shorea laevis]